MLRKHASLIVALCLVGFVVAACIVRTGPRPVRRGAPVYVEKHKHKKPPPPKKHKKGKHKKHHDRD